jgi:hypothetical protein
MPVLSRTRLLLRLSSGEEIAIFSLLPCLDEIKDLEMLHENQSCSGGGRGRLARSTRRGKQFEQGKFLPLRMFIEA